MCVQVMSRFKWGHGFFSANEQLLQLYSGCATGAQVIAVQNQWLQGGSDGGLALARNLAAEGQASDWDDESEGEGEEEGSAGSSGGASGSEQGNEGGSEEEPTEEEEVDEEDYRRRMNREMPPSESSSDGEEEEEEAADVRGEGQGHREVAAPQAAADEAAALAQHTKAALRLDANDTGQQ